MTKKKELPRGVAHFRKMAAGKVPRTPMGELLGLQLLEADAGRVVFGAHATAAHHNTMGIAHGGLVATLLDSALGCAVNTLSPPGRVFTTLELNVNFIRPITDDVGPLRCEARALHVGKRVGTAEGRVVDSRGKLYAHGTTTMIAIEPQPTRGRRRRV
jgi:uncharacterized protein (TIGR00369 family)